MPAHHPRLALDVLIHTNADDVSAGLLLQEYVIVAFSPISLLCVSVYPCYHLQGNRDSGLLTLAISATLPLRAVKYAQVRLAAEIMTEIHSTRNAVSGTNHFTTEQ